MQNRNTKHLHELLKSLTTNENIISRIANFMRKNSIPSTADIYEIIDQNQDISSEKKEDFINQIKREIGESPVDNTKINLFHEILRENKVSHMENEMRLA